ncbi:DUF421 domain-containing protein [Virgibacillus doumboii]|uniref:DUF421 domain-containing protein n=1 Tax=Virgibacillus doumboii TaxID=2697503 RepID=UPI0013E0B0FF|nr:DUF421 domain-containing protein [Virgibacillus doumboii]
MENLPSITIEAIFGFLALFILTKILGKTQITQLTAFDFISALVLGELVGNALFDDEVGIIEIGYAVLLWGIILYITEIITQKFKESRSILEGQPAIIIHKGNLIREEMKKNKLDINQLQHMLRSKNAFSIQEVEYAVLETDGTISVLKKADYQNPTNSDMNIVASPARLPVTLINDGEILWDNLREENLTEEWLQQQLRAQNIGSVKKVFYAEWTENQPGLFVLPFTKR